MGRRGSLRYRTALLAVSAVGLFVGPGAADAWADEVADYELQGDHTSTVPTSTTLTDIGTGNAFLSEIVGGRTREFLSIPEGNGLQLANTGALSEAILIKVRLDETAGYRRILDSRNGTDDVGIYDNDGHVDIFLSSDNTSSSVVFTPNVYTELTIVSYYDFMAGFTQVYADGVLAVQGPGDFTGNTLRFLKDNTTGGTPNEEAGGGIACIRFFTGNVGPLLTAEQVAQLHAQGGCSYAGELLPVPPDTTPPNTNLKRKPPKRGTDRTPTFRFRSNEAGSTFRCKLDHKRFRRCTSPFTTKRLGAGRHTFRVEAVDASGNVDATPAKYSFRILG